MYKITNLKYKQILDIKNLSISNNHLTFITGESGSGKSSLLKLLLGLDFEYEGEILYNNNNMKNIEEIVLRNEIGYLSQAHTFFTPTIQEEFDYITSMLKLNNKSYDEMLELVNLNYSLDTNISILSGGELQRLSLARLLLTNKKVLLLDEPTSSLDNNLENELMDNLHNYAKKMKIKLIVVTHNKSILNNYECQKVIINNGEVIANES